jgi:hypothetical protein
MNMHSELVVARRAVPALRDLRGPRWAALVARVAKSAETDPDAQAFALVKINLNGCCRCDLQRYRARVGCASCASSFLESSAKETEARLLTKLTRPALVSERTWPSGQPCRRRSCRCRFVDRGSTFLRTRR